MISPPSMKTRVDLIMEQAQCFASTWSSVDGPFDAGDTLERAEAEKVELRRLIEQTVKSAESAEQARQEAVQHCAEILAAHKFNVTGMPAHQVHAKLVAIGLALGGIPQNIMDDAQARFNQGVSA